METAARQNKKVLNTLRKLESSFNKDAEGIVDRIRAQNMRAGGEGTPSPERQTNHSAPSGGDEQHSENTGAETAETENSDSTDPAYDEHGAAALSFAAADAVNMIDRYGVDIGEITRQVNTHAMVASGDIK